MFAAQFMNGCANVADVGREPEMSLVGTGARGAIQEASALLHQPNYSPANNSTWNESRGSLFRDLRAKGRGDIVTIDISIDDRATLGNQSNRSKEAKAHTSMDYLLKFFGIDTAGSTSTDIQSVSTSNGKGDIQRSEKIKMSIAAIVTRSLPNGNLLISGTQEIRVNFELRVLKIEGVVKPEDISKDNRISYDKIAEARVSYGGRGRMTEVQQPQLVHQLYDMVRPF